MLLPAYDFDFLIAQSEMGAVYKACQRSLERDVAIKLLPRMLGNDPLFRDSFEAEAKAMARLSHTYLIKVFDYGEADGLLYIVMEYVHGSSLFNSANGKKIDPHQAVEIVLKASRGLAHAHENGIVHRDIEPANIFLNQKCEPKIGNFGLARPTGHQSVSLDMIVPGYAAPEVLSHPDQADLRSDIFAMGTILKEMLTGLSANGEAFKNTACEDARIAAICTKATAEEPSMRFASVGEFCQSLESWQRLGQTKQHQAAPNRPSIPPSRQVPLPRREASTLRRPSPPTANTGASNWKLWKNCAVIAALLAAVPLTGKIYQKSQEVASQEMLVTVKSTLKPIDSAKRAEGRQRMGELAYSSK